jgi:methylenetetrahydrofolate dehydrogenase (NADP+) / methenyltetrahydrofolate cyclohydrolase
VRLKCQDAAFYNIEPVVLSPDFTKTEDVVSLVCQLNTDPSVDGIIAQLPLPEGINEEAVIAALTNHKDVDDLNITATFTSPMVQSVAAMEQEYNLDFATKRVVLVGYGRLVGRPIARWLRDRGIEPVIIERNTPNADKLIAEGEVLILGSGVKHRVTRDMVHSGHIILDCGGGESDFEGIKDAVAHTTPPTKGIGPLTRHFLMMNVRESLERNSH